MAIDKEFLDRLDREIASLKARIESTKQDAGTSPPTEAEANTLRETEALLISTRGNARKDRHAIERRLICAIRRRFRSILVVAASYISRN